MKYEHICAYGSSLVGIQGYRNNTCRKCRPVKGGQPKIIKYFTINDVDYEITTSHLLYKLRSSIIRRCYTSKKINDINNYQLKGIKVCDEWGEDPRSFYKWCITNGWSAGLSIDRIDNNKGYEPSNCQFLSISDNVKKSYIDNPRLGEDHGSSKLNDLKVIEIKKQLRLGISCVEISKQFSTCVSNIRSIKYGNTWKHIN